MSKIKISKRRIENWLNKARTTIRDTFSFSCASKLPSLHSASSNPSTQSGFPSQIEPTRMHWPLPHLASKNQQGRWAETKKKMNKMIDYLSQKMIDKVTLLRQLRRFRIPSKKFYARLVSLLTASLWGERKPTCGNSSEKKLWIYYSIQNKIATPWIKNPGWEKWFFVDKK